MELELGEGLIKCNGQDISRKGKSKNLMVILPTDFAFQKGTEGIIGYFVKLESSNPELVIETEIGILRYRGRYVNSTSQFLSIILHPRKNQSVCQDITSRFLIFDENLGFSPSDKSNMKVPSLTKSDDGGDTQNSLSWTTHFGCSSQTDNKSVRSKGNMSRSNGSQQKEREKYKDSDDESNHQSEIDADLSDSASDSDASVMELKLSGDTRSPVNRRHSNRLTKLGVSYKDNLVSESEDLTSESSEIDDETIEPKSKSKNQVKNIPPTTTTRKRKISPSTSTTIAVRKIRNSNVEAIESSKPVHQSTPARNSQRSKTQVNYIEISSDTEKSSDGARKKRTKRGVSSDDEDTEWSE